jgi:hypothetical protein
MFTRQLGEGVEVTHLGLDTLRGAVKPEALGCAPVNAQRSTDGIAVPAGLQRIVLGEDLDSFPLNDFADSLVLPCRHTPRGRQELVAELVEPRITM